MSTSTLDLRDKVVKAACDRIDDDDAISLYLDSRPFKDTQYARPSDPTAGQPAYWTEGDGRPALGDDDPAVMQAIGRCAASRIRWGGELPVRGSIHPAPCGWCGYPLRMLLSALAWSVVHSGLVLSETLTWSGANESTYTRPGRHNVYLRPEWAEFWGLPRRRDGSCPERERRVQAAVEASRASAEAPV